MCLFKRKSKTEKNTVDYDLVSSNYKYVDTLLVLAKDGEDPTIEEKLTAIKNKLQFLIPSPEDKVKDYDKKIKNALEDVKIALVKDKADAKVKSLLLDLELAIAERNSAL